MQHGGGENEDSRRAIMETINYKEPEVNEVAVGGSINQHAEVNNGRVMNIVENSVELVVDLELGPVLQMERSPQLQFLG